MMKWPVRAVERVRDLLCSRRFVALLLVLLLAVCLIAVLVPQEGTPTNPQWTDDHPALARIAEAAGLDRIFSSPVAITLLALLTASGVVSVLSRLNQLRPRASLRGWGPILMKRRRLIGSLVFHAGLIGLVVAGAMSALTRSEGALVLTEGQALRVDETTFDAGVAPKLQLGSNEPFEVRLDKFHPVHKGSYGTPDYVSDVTVIRDNRELAQATVGVNQPLVVGDVTLHQRVHGFSPLIELYDGQGRRRFASFVALNTEKDLDPVRYRDDFGVPGTALTIEAEFFPDAYMEGNTLANRSPVPNNPVMSVVVRNGMEVLYQGPVFYDNVVEIGSGMYLRFSDLRYWSGFDAVRDRGLVLLFASAWIAVAGLIVRFVPRWRLRHA